MLATIPSAALASVDGQPVTIEVHVSNGLPGFTIVGLPDAACRESRDRVRAALLSSGLPWPLRRTTVNLAPTNVRKGGAGLDLGIAVGLLVAAGDLPAQAVEGFGFIGELGLDGSVRPVPGVISLVDGLGPDVAVAVVPPGCAPEARLVGRHQVREAPTLRSLVDGLTGAYPWPDPAPPPPAPPAGPPSPDLIDVRGQPLGRWALEVAAAGAHHLLLVGPPGAGKTMLAARLPGLLPQLEPAHALEVTRVHSVAGLGPAGGLIDRPPFRAPHHSASAVSLVGGGGATLLRPGEVSLAHRGVLFLDELPEFSAAVLDQLRQPLEEGVVRIARARATATMPARVLLVAAMNPCPCGDDRPGRCRCSEPARQRYARRVSGPLLDRFDLRVPVPRAVVPDMLGGADGESSAVVRQRVEAARRRAAERGVEANSAIPAGRLDELAAITAGAKARLARRLEAGSLSGRGLHRVRRVARTLADLAGHDGPVDDEHVVAALLLRGDDSPDLQAAS